ncbi:hypothetical protein [Loigolactobacillus zhaoyuanensis]|uniref:Uncharacterized protein n=1 Tax=Loigolactobacillus zhaoyuanensis TaxID=2486017 RepID=A0ABW8UEC1_9LACO
MKQIAGTIMLIDRAGAPKFLVNKAADQYHLIMTEQKTALTPLASVLGLFKDQLGIDVTDLRLDELSNVVIQDKNISLFIFEWGTLATTQVSENIVALQAHGYTFEHPKELRSLLKQIDMSGVPHFN